MKAITDPKPPQLRRQWTQVISGLVLMLLLIGPVRAQQPGGTQTPVQSQPAPDDRSAIRVRQPRPDQVDAYRRDRDYQYGQDVVPVRSPWANFWAWLMRKISSFFASNAYQNFWQYVILALIAGLAIWLLIKAEIAGFVFNRSTRGPSLGYETLTENIHEINFEEQIEAAIEQRNYRLAVRLLYLQTLKRLTDRNLIDWKPDKTNRSYVYELAQSPLQREFEALTTQFEYIWYGDFSVDEDRFRPLRDLFVRFNP